MFIKSIAIMSLFLSSTCSQIPLLEKNEKKSDVSRESEDEKNKGETLESSNYCEQIRPVTENSESKLFRKFGTEKCNFIDEISSQCKEFDKLKTCIVNHHKCLCKNGEVKIVQCKNLERLKPVDRFRCLIATRIDQEHPYYDVVNELDPIDKSFKFASNSFCKLEEDTEEANGLFEVAHSRCEQNEMARPSGVISCIEKYTYSERKGQIQHCSEIHEDDSVKMEEFQKECESKENRVFKVDESCPKTEEFVFACQKKQGGRYAARFYYNSSWPFEAIKGVSQHLSPKFQRDLYDFEMNCLDENKSVGVLYPWDKNLEYLQDSGGKFRGPIKGHGTVIFSENTFE